MPFHDLPLKLLIVFASLLAHQVLVVRCASLGVLPNATLALSNPSAPDSSSHGQSGTIDLMDDNKLTFLNDCKIDSGSIKICELYRNLTAVLSERKRDPVTATDVNTIIAEQMDAERFCINLAPLFHVMSQRHPDSFGNYHLENNRLCEKLCVPIDDVTLSMHVKPICKVLLWGFKRELQPDIEAEDPVEQAAKAVMPPLLPIAGRQIEENDHAETNPAQPVAAAQPNITLPDNTAKAAPPKKTETDRAKVSSDDTAAVVPPAVNADVSASQTTATSIPTKPVTPPVVRNPVEGDDDQDPNELQNQENLKDMNGDGLSNNVQEDGDTDDDPMLDDLQLEDTQETSENVQPKLDEEPFGVKRTHASGTAGDQKADSSAVQVERVEQEDPFFDPDDSNFFSYFLFMMFMCILCYVAYHNKSKLLALLLEGRRTNSGRGGFNKGRKHTAAYRKLDSNLEEAITSNAAPGSRSTSQIIY